MTDLPKAIASSELVICGVTQRCHVLDNGQRVMEADGVEALFEAFGEGADLSEDDAMAMARFTRQ